MSTDGKTDEVIVELCGTAWKGNSLFVQINQDRHIKWDKAQTIDSQIAFKIFGKFINCLWLQCFFYKLYSFCFSETQDVYPKRCILAKFLCGM